MENKMMNKSVQKVSDALQHFGINTKIIEFSESTRTAQDAADALKCNIAQIIKSLIFRIKETDQPILVLVSGKNRVNEKTLQQLIGEPIEKADANFTRHTTGFVIGGIPPIAHTQAIKTFIDEDLLRYQELWAAAGTQNTVFRIRPNDLVKITTGIVVKNIEI